MTKKLGLIAVVALAAISMANGAPGAAQTPAGALPANSPPAGGTISIEPRPDGGYDAAMPAFVDAISKALTARGFTVFEDRGHAASVVELLLSRSRVGTGLARVPGQHAPSIAGTGIGVPLGTGSSEIVFLQRVRLEMRIHRRGETGTVWNGAAVTVRESGVKNGTDAAIAADLAQALLASYPAQPQGVVGVP